MIGDLLTLDKLTLEPPTSRVGSISGVRSRIAELKKGDDLRAEHRTEVQGIIDGNRPYNVEGMINAGRGDDANINLRQAEGRVAAGVTPYYELDFGVPRAANISIEYGDNRQKWMEWSEAISDRFSSTLWSWRGYKINKQLSHYQMVVHGRGPVLWESNRGWYFKAKKDEAVWVSDDTMCDLELLPEMALPGHYGPIELFRLMDDAPKNSGWNKEMAKLAIMKAAPKTLRDSYHDQWSEYQTSLRRGDVSWNNKELRIYYTDYLIKEFDGKITHCIVLDTTPERKDNQDDDFVFKKVGRFESFNEIINPFFYDVGPDGCWYSVKGYGPKIFDFCDLNNRFYCTLINAAMAQSGIFLQAESGTAFQKLQFTPMARANGATYVPPDWKFLQQNIGARLDGPLALMQRTDNILESNTGQYQQLDDTPQPTLGQEQIEASSRSKLTRGAYDRYYHYQDDLLLEVLRRMLDPNLSKKDCGGEAALEMRRKLIEEDDVPKEALDMRYVMQVQAMRNVGYGSPQRQQVVGQQLMGMIGMMNEQGRNATQRMVAAGLVGQSHVDAIFPKFEDLGIPNDQEAWATFENNVLRMPNAQLEVTPAQNPAIHFDTHFKDAMLHVQQVNGGQGDPVALVTHLDNVGPHNLKHLEAMKGDPTRKDQCAQMVKMEMMLGKVADQVKKQVKDAQAQQQPPQPQIDPKMIADILQVQGELKLKEIKLQDDMSRRERQFQQKSRLADIKTADHIKRKNAETFQPQPMNGAMQ